MNPAAASKLLRAPFCEKAFPPISCSSRHAGQRRRKSFLFSLTKGIMIAPARKKETESLERWFGLGNCVIGGGRHGHCPCSLSGHCCLLVATESQGASFAKAGSVLREGGQASARKFGLVTQAPNMRRIFYQPQSWPFHTPGFFVGFFSSKVEPVLRWSKVDVRRSKKPPTLKS